MPDLLARLMAYALGKPGATPEEFGGVTVLGGFLDTFYRGPEDDEPGLLLRVSTRERNALAKKHPGVQESGRMHWDTKGWAWTDVPADGSVPEKTLFGLIDRSYELVLKAKDDDTRYQIALIGRNLSPRELLAELIGHFGFTRLKKQIEAFAEPAIQLMTTTTDEDALPLGASKIGGRPDLPPGVAWPKHSSGKPLAFLAQIDLAAAAEAAKLPGVPRTGLLQFFSVYGWQEEGDGDPNLPDGRPAADWTQVLYHAEPGKLKRTKVPAKVNGFPAAAVSFVAVLTPPGDRREPARAALDMSDEEQDRFTDLYFMFDTVTNYPLGNPPPHRLGGYAQFIQDIYDPVADGKLRLLFQLASDGDAGMGWGDGGHLYFLIRPADLSKKRFDRVEVDYQCG